MPPPPFSTFLATNHVRTCKSTTTLVHRRRRSNQPSPMVESQPSHKRLSHGNDSIVVELPIQRRVRFCCFCSVLGAKQPIRSNISSSCPTWRSAITNFIGCSRPSVGSPLNNFGQLSSTFSVFQSHRASSHHRSTNLTNPHHRNSELLSPSPQFLCPTPST